MSKFFSRNKPIFSIGALIALVFIAIIVFYKLSPRNETSMSQIKDETLYKIVEEEQKVYEEDLYSGTTTQEEFQTEPQYTAQAINIDEKYGILEIEYTNEGFKPRITDAFLNQTVRWTNKTDKTINLHQRKQTYEELINLVEIKPGESFSFRMSVLGIWTYEENESKHFGSIEVLDVPIPYMPE